LGEIFWPFWPFFGLFLAYVVVTRIEIVEDFQIKSKSYLGQKADSFTKKCCPYTFFSKIVDNILGWARSCLKFEKSFCRDKIAKDVYSTIFFSPVTG
jgi:hypothetical protein